MPQITTFSCLKLSKTLCSFTKMFSTQSWNTEFGLSHEPDNLIKIAQTTVIKSLPSRAFL